MQILPLAGNLVAFCLPAAVASVGAARLAKSSRDEWKLLVWLPVVPLAIWGPYVALGVTRDPTSHNLWPLEFMYWSALSLVLLVTVLVLRRMFGGPRPDW